MRVRVPIRKADQASRLSGIQTINVDTTFRFRIRAGGLAGPDASASSRCGHASGQSVHADEGHGSGPVRQRPPDLGRARHDDRHPRHRSRPRQPESSTSRARASARSSTGSPTRIRLRTATRLGGLSAGTVNVVGGAFTAFATAYTGVPVDGTYKFARMREDLARRGERVRHRLRRRPQPKRRLRRLLRHPLAGLEQQRHGRLRQRPQLR